MRTRDDENNSLSFETLHLSSKGYVPARFLDPLSGEVERGVPMVAPTYTRYTQLCGECGAQVQQTRLRSRLKKSHPCPQCKKPVTEQTARHTAEVLQTPGFEAIGSFAYDDLTSASDWLLQDMSHRKNLEGEKAALGGDIESGSMVFRGNNRSQVGMAQTRIHELVANSLGIPNLIVMPFWTAISHESSDDTGRLTVIGPKLAGDAKTYIAPSWFGNTVEAQVITNERKQYIRRLYVTQWYDEYNRRHLCGHRGDPRFMPAYYEDEPYSDAEAPKEICTGFSLKQLMLGIEESIRLSVDADQIKDAPGFAAIPATYGDTEVDDAAAPAATAATNVKARPTVQGRRPRPSVQGKAPEAPKLEAQPATEPPTEQPAATEAAADAAGNAAGTAPAAEAAVVQPADTPEEAPPPVQPATPAAPAPPAAQAAVADKPLPPASVSSAGPPGTAWGRPAGNRPPPPRAPQSGPKPPARSAPKPVGTVKPS